MEGPPAIDSLRTRQIAALKTMVNMNQQPVNVLVSEPVWKVLIMDSFGQDIVSPLLPVKQLQELGVTLHMLLNKKRDALPDVPAVYFVAPTEENIALMEEDLRAALYGSFYVNTISPLARPKLEQLATAAYQGGTIGQVEKVVDQYLNYIALEEDLFVLRRFSENVPTPFYNINDPSTTEHQMNVLIDWMAEGLFSVVATLGVVPIIRCPAGNAAEGVAQRLESKIRDNLRDARNNLFVADSFRGGQLAASRPLLLIADRSTDLATMLHHTWSYQALVHDVMGLEQNRVRLTESSNGKTKEYDLSTGGPDVLWSRQRGAPFPVVAEAIQSEVEEYKGKEAEIKRLKEHMGLGDVSGAETEAAMGALSDGSNRLGSAVTSLGSTVTSLPALLARKRLIDQHTTIATTLLQSIKERKLDTLFEIEQRIMQRGQLDKPLADEVAALTHGDDALRIVLIYLLCHPNLPKAERDALLTAVRAKELDEAAIRFVQRMKGLSDLTRSLDINAADGPREKSLFSKFISHGSNLFMEGVKQLIPKKRNTVLTQMVDSIIAASSTPSAMSSVSGMAGGGHSTSEADALRLLDPKLMTAAPMSREATAARARQLPPPQDVIVFVVGGGNYVEYQNLVEYGKAKGLARVTYGCTELMNPKQFLDQLTQLGRLHR